SFHPTRTRPGPGLEEPTPDRWPDAHALWLTIQRSDRSAAADAGPSRRCLSHQTPHAVLRALGTLAPLPRRHASLNPTLGAADTEMCFPGKVVRPLND